MSIIDSNFCGSCFNLEESISIPTCEICGKALCWYCVENEANICAFCNKVMICKNCQFKQRDKITFYPNSTNDLLVCYFCK